MAYQPATRPCISVDADATYRCQPLLFRDTNVLLTAVVDPGWIFIHWFMPAGPPQESPSRSTATAPGRCSSYRRLRHPAGHPVRPDGGAAERHLRRGASATKYRTVIQNPRHFVLTYQWSGPTCGDWTPQEERTGHKSTLEAVMTWTHAEPCRSGDEPVVLTVRGWPDLAVLTCVYSGTDTGQGPECKQGL